MNMSVAEYVIHRLSQLGINKAFGVPGDFSFPIDDAIEDSTCIDWVVSSNELNAAYAADGYARRKGYALLTVTYGVGLLSALNGILGSYAHRLPIFVVAGSPSQRIVKKQWITHHSLGYGRYDDFDAITNSAFCAQTTLNPQNVIEELERIICTAFKECRPVFINISEEAGYMPILKTNNEMKAIEHLSVPKELDGALESIVTHLKQAKNPIAIISANISRYGLNKKMQALIDKFELNFTIMPMDKGVLDESSIYFVGIYSGQFSHPKEVKSFVESSDLIIDFGGVVFEQFNTGFFSTDVSQATYIKISAHDVSIGSQVFNYVYIGDVIDGMSKHDFKTNNGRAPYPYEFMPLIGEGVESLKASNLFPRLQRFFKSNDIVISESGASCLNLSRLRLAHQVGFETQLLWGSIGWATPAALGVALAEPDKRVVLVTGDGAHQMSFNEIAVMGRYQIKPVIFVINNDAHGAEYLISEKRMRYNELPIISYNELPKVMGCTNWFTAKIDTVAQLDDVLDKINNSSTAAYVQLVVDASEYQSLSHALIDQAYQLDTPKKP